MPENDLARAMRLMQRQTGAPSGTNDLARAMRLMQRQTGAPSGTNDLARAMQLRDERRRKSLGVTASDKARRAGFEPGESISTVRQRAYQTPEYQAAEQAFREAESRGASGADLEALSEARAGAFETAQRRLFAGNPDARRAVASEVEATRESYREHANKKRWIDVMDEIERDPARLVPFLGAAKQADDLLRIHSLAKRVEDGQAGVDDLRELEQWVRDSQREPTFAAQVADILAELPAFAGEMLIASPLAAGGRAVAGRAGLTALRNRVRSALVKKTGRSLAGRAALRAGAGALAGASVASGEAVRFLPSATFGRAQSEAIRRSLPAMRMQENDAGALEVVLDGPVEDWRDNMAAGFVDTYVEFLTEQAGGMVRFLPGAGMARGIKGAIARRWMHKTGGTVNDLARRLSAGAKRAGRLAGWNGVIGEIFEERTGEAARGGLYALSDGEFGAPYQVPTLEQLATEAVAFTLVPLGAGAVTEAAGAVDRFAGRRGGPAAGGQAPGGVSGAPQAPAAPAGSTAPTGQAAPPPVPGIPQRRPLTPEEATGTPVPDFTLADGVPVFNDQARAERLAAFRNERLAEGEPGYRAVPLFRAAEGSPWIVVPEQQEASNVEVQQQGSEVVDGVQAAEELARDQAGGREGDEGAQAPQRLSAAESAEAERIGRESGIGLPTVRVMSRMVGRELNEDEVSAWERAFVRGRAGQTPPAPPEKVTVTGAERPVDAPKVEVSPAAEPAQAPAAEKSFDEQLDEAIDAGEMSQIQAQADAIKRGEPDAVAAFESLKAAAKRNPGGWQSDEVAAIERAMAGESPKPAPPAAEQAPQAEGDGFKEYLSGPDGAPFRERQLLALPDAERNEIVDAAVAYIREQLRKARTDRPGNRSGAAWEKKARTADRMGRVRTLEKNLSEWEGLRARSAPPAAEQAREPWQMTRGEYVSAIGGFSEEAESSAGYYEREAADFDMFEGKKPVRSEGEYDIYQSGDDFYAFRRGAAEDEKAVGIARGERGQTWVAVHPDHQNRGIGTALAELLRNRAPLRPSGGLSSGGVQMARRLHRRAVERALSTGLPVPPEVLADYPDLAPKAATPKGANATPDVAAPAPEAAAPTAPKGRMDELRARADELIRRAEALEKRSSTRFDTAPGALITGGSGRRRSGLHQKTERAIEGSLNDLRKAKQLRRIAGKLRERADRLDPTVQAEQDEKKSRVLEARKRLAEQESAKRAAAPIVNEDKAGNVRMTKAEWGKVHSDFKNVAVRNGVRVRTIMRGGTLSEVFLTDAPVKNRPAEPAAAPPAPEAPALSTLSRDALLALAKSEGVAIPTPSHKAALVKAIEGKRAGTESTETAHPTIRAYVDELKRWMKGRAAIGKVDADAKREWLRDFGIPSSDTGRKLRYVYELSDGRKVSADGALKFTNPEAYERISKRHANLATAAARVEVFNALPDDVRTQIVDQLPIGEMALAGGDVYGAINKHLTSEGHILAEIWGRLPEVRNVLTNRIGHLQEAARSQFTDRVSAARAWRQINKSDAPIVTLERDGKFVSTRRDSDKHRDLIEYGGWVDVDANNAPDAAPEAPTPEPESARGDAGRDAAPAAEPATGEPDAGKAVARRAGTVKFGQPKHGSVIAIPGAKKVVGALLLDEQGNVIDRLDLVQERHRSSWNIYASGPDAETKSGTVTIKKPTYVHLGEADDLRAAKKEASAILLGEYDPRTPHHERLRPLGELTPSVQNGWDGKFEITGESVFISDGRAMILKSALKPKALDELQENEAEQGRSVQPQAVSEIWESTLKAAKNPATLMGFARGIAIDMAYFDMGTSAVALDANRTRYIQEITGANNFLVSRPDRAVLFLKDEKPVALLMPVRIDEAKFDYDKAKGDTAPKPKRGKGAKGNPAEPSRAAPLSDRIEAWAEGVIADIRSRRTPTRLPGSDLPGMRRGGTSLPSEIADKALYLTAQLLRGAVKGYRAAKAALIAEFGAISNPEAESLFAEAVRMTRAIENAEAPTVKQAVLDRLAPKNISKQGKEPKAPKPGPLRETKIIAQAFREGRDRAITVLGGIAAEARKAAKADAKTREAKIEGLRDEVVRLVTDHLPPKMRGAFLTDVKNVRTLGDLSRSIGKMRRTLARWKAAELSARIRTQGKWDRLRRLSGVEASGVGTLSYRAHAKTLIDEAAGIADEFKRQVGKARSSGFTADVMEAKVERLEAILNTLLGYQAIFRNERKLIALGRGATLADLTEKIVEEVDDAKGQAAPTREEERQDPATRARSRYGNLTRDMLTLAGRFSKTLTDTLYHGMVRFEERYLSQRRDRYEAVSKAVKEAGFKDLDDAIDRTSRRGGTGRTTFRDVTIGGVKVRLTLGNILKIAAMLGDEDTAAQLRKGRKVVLEGGRKQVPLETTFDELQAIADTLTVDELAIVEQGRIIREGDRPALARVHRRIKGYEPKWVVGYEPRSVERAVKEAPGTFETMFAGGGTRWLENMGFLKERTGGGEALVIGDYLTDLMESLDNMAKVIHLAAPIRDAYAVLTARPVSEAIVRKGGRDTYGLFKEYLVAASRANDLIRSLWGRFIQHVNRIAAVAKLGLNPRTWLRQLGTIPRMRASMSGAAFRAGLRGMWGVGWHDLYQSGYLYDRYHQHAEGRFSSQVETQSRGRRVFRDLERAFLNLVRRGEFRAAFRALQDAAAAPLEILQWWDSVTSRFAWAAAAHEAKKRGLDGEKATRYTIQRANQLVRENNNASSVLDMPMIGIAGKDTAAAIFTLFTSDSMKAKTRIERAATRGPKALAAHLGAEAVNIAWGLGVTVAIGAGIAAAVGMLGGEDDTERLIAESVQPKYLGLRAFRDAVSMVDPLMAPRVLEWASGYSEQGRTMLDAPAISMFQDVEKAVARGIRAFESEDEGRMIEAADILARDVTAIVGLNPLQSLWREVSRTIKALDD